LGRSLDVTELDSNSHGSGNAFFDVLSDTSGVSDSLVSAHRDGAIIITITIDPSTLRSGPRTRTRLVHSPLLLSVSVALVELRIAITRELEAFLGSHVLPNVYVTYTRVVQFPLLV